MSLVSVIPSVLGDVSLLLLCDRLKYPALTAPHYSLLHCFCPQTLGIIVTADKWRQGWRGADWWLPRVETGGAVARENIPHGLISVLTALSLLWPIINGNVNRYMEYNILYLYSSYCSTQKICITMTICS